MIKNWEKSIKNWSLAFPKLFHPIWQDRYFALSQVPSGCTAFLPCRQCGCDPALSMVPANAGVYHLDLPRRSESLHSPLEPFSHLSPFVQMAPVKSAPDKLAPERSALERFASAKNASERLAPERLALVRKAPERLARDRLVLESLAFERLALDSWAPESWAPERSALWRLHHRHCLVDKSLAKSSSLNA